MDGRTDLPVLYVLISHTFCPKRRTKRGLPFFIIFDVCRYTCSDRQSLPKDFLQITAMPSASLLFYPHVASYILSNY